MKETFVMQKRELDRGRLLEKVKNGQITLEKASKLLNLSYRQIVRISKKFNESGPTDLIHARRGKRSHRKISEERKNEV